jgi:BirA family biotin operon repressor/biotin-[acetyl-CoA-carboxylase] ligase
MWPSGWHVEHVPEIGSTNTALLAAAATLPDRSVLYADHQTAGRGRLDRRWDAPPRRNLLASFLFHVVPDPPIELTWRIGLAAIDACRATTGAEATLKWPNDVLMAERKLAGILAQRGAAGEVVVGLGLNVGWAPADGARLGDGIEPAAALAAVLTAFDALPAHIAPRYRAALGTLGRHVRVELPNETIEGTATDVGPDGRLVVRDERGVAHRVDAGDVIHLRTP